MSDNERLDQPISSTSVRYCPKCGSAYPFSQEFCGNCGCKMGGATKKSVSIKLIIIITACVIAMGTIAAVILLNNTPQKRFGRAIDKGDYAKAAEIWEKSSSDSSFKAIANVVMADKAGELVTSYAAGEIDRAELDKITSTMSKAYDFSQRASELEALDASKLAWSEAGALRESKQYLEAIDKYNEVAENDTEHFSQVKTMQTECSDEYSAYMITLADDEIKKNDSETGFTLARKKLDEAMESGFANDSVKDRIEALEDERKEFVCKTALDKASKEKSPISGYEILCKVNKDDRTDSFSKELTSYATEAENYFADKMREHKEKNDYNGAFAFYKRISEDAKKLDGIKSVYKAFSDDYVEAVLKQAKGHADGGKYAQAVAVIETAEKNLSHSKLASTRKKYQREADIAYLKSAKNYFGQKLYDDFNNYWFVQPYSTNYYSDFGRKYTIQPYLMIYNTHVNFRMDMGFHKDDWIFMNKITIDCDGRQFNYSVNYSDRETDVDGGMITEIWDTIHTTDSYSIRNISTAYDHTKMLEAMANAKSVKVRFSGSDGHYDFYLSQDEVNRITVYWHIYQILDRDISLKSYIV